MNEISLFKTAVLKWAYNTLHAEFPEYFNLSSYVNLDGETIKNSPNVFWSDTVKDRPLDATYCYLDVVSDEAVNWGVDDEFYQDTDGKYYYKMQEFHEITVSFTVSSMKNKNLNLTALQAQNLSHNACSYLRMLLKSTSTSATLLVRNAIATA